MMAMTCIEDYERGLVQELVTRIDPLGADAVCARLPDMNAAADVDQLVISLRDLVPSAADLATYSPFECLAAMRDLGMFMGSIKRHGVAPTAAIPELEPVLITLGERTDLVPRDTVHHYTVWNPATDRQRMYTADPQEGYLINSVRIAMPRLGSALEVCRGLAELDPRDSHFVAAIDALGSHLQGMVEAIDIAVGNVSPVFFAHELRPYFEEITVGGVDYLGPAAAHVPLASIDLLLWSSDHGCPEYTEFQRESVVYSLPCWRGLFQEWADRPSIATKLINECDRSGEATHLAVATFCQALRTLVVFRGRHLSMARKAYHEEIRRYPVGSGGASIDLLAQILDLTRCNAALVRGHPVGCHG